LFKPFWVIAIASMVLVNCSIKNQLDRTVASNQVKGARSPAISPLTVFTVQKPFLKNTDQLAVSFDDFTLSCRSTSNANSEGEGPTFICGQDSDTKLVKTRETPLIFGIGQVWLPVSKRPTHLWVNQTLYSCHLAPNESLDCVKAPPS